MAEIWADRTEKMILNGAVVICLGILIVLLATGNASESVFDAVILFILLLSFALILRRGFIDEEE